MPNALEYLLLPIDERINSRYEQNLSLLGWYNSVVGNVEKVEGPISRSAARMRLGLSRYNIDRLVELDFLRTEQGTNGHVLFEPESLYKFELMLRKTVPAYAIVKYFQIKRSNEFYKHNSGLVIDLAKKKSSRSRRLSFSDFSRIVFSLYEKEKAKEQTKGFYTVRELAEALGIHKSTVHLNIRAGFIEAVNISWGGNGTYEISPLTFFKALDDYRRLRLFTGKETYYNTKEVAAESGYGTENIGLLIRKGYLSATKFARLNPYGTYLFTEQEFLNALDKLSKRRFNESKYKTIDDVAEESYGYAPGTVADLIRKGVISATAFVREENNTYAFDEEQFAKATAVLNARAQLGTIYLPHSVRVKRRIEFQNKVKGITVDLSTISLADTIHELPIKDELKLWMLTTQGNNKAFNELLRLYQSDIYKYAHYEFGPLSLDDRVAEGQLALWRTVSRAYNFQWARPRALLNIRYSIRSANREERKLTNTGVRVRDLDNILVE